MADLVRLHISPLNPALLPVIISSTLKPKAQDISFHKVDTFPERDYGFVSLPVDEAEKLIKKLNGTLLRGVRMKIDKARVDGRKIRFEEETKAESESTPLRRSTRSSQSPGVAAEMSGVELEDGRTVKRGWTDPSRPQKKKHVSKDSLDTSMMKKKQAKSEYSDKAEMLFRTDVPPTKRSNGHDEKHDSKRRKSDDGSHVSVVHEFENTTKFPTFLKTASVSSNPVAEYDDEKGWVDKDGNVVEPAVQSNRPKPTIVTANTSLETPVPVAPRREELLPSIEVHEDVQARPSVEEEAPPTATTPFPIVETPTAPAASPHPLETLFKRPKRDSLNGNKRPVLGLQIPFSFFESDTPATNPVATPALVVPEEEESVPQTPFTRKDLFNRGQRSAAPTPDTAHPLNRPGKNVFWASHDKPPSSRSDPFSQAALRASAANNAAARRPSRLGALSSTNEDENEEEDVIHSVETGGQITATATGTGTNSAQTEHEDENGIEHDEDGAGGVEESKETKEYVRSEADEQDRKEHDEWFYKHRGEINRGWKQARREALKEERQRKNREGRVR